jgi:DNA topoisomerase II
MNQHNHILRNPNMYIGSMEKESVDMWIYNNNRFGTDPEIILKKISYVPGLYKIFDEILVNARDHVFRCWEQKCEPCTVIQVYIDDVTGKITIWNDGASIPIIKHQEHDILIPSIIFGELLTSKNYNYDEQKVKRKNTFSAALTNIFSTEFKVKISDVGTKQKFYQNFTNNMYNKTDAMVTSNNDRKSYTKISFIPDFEKFGIKGLTTDIVALFKKRVYDIAMTCDAEVYYNGKLIEANSIAKYVDLYFPTGSGHIKVFDVTNKNCKVCAIYDPTGKLKCQNISFVNGICTSRGGTHVDYISNQIIKKLQKSKLESLFIKENLIFFMDTLIINPVFDTQSRELLMNIDDFRLDYNLSDAFISNLITNIVDKIVESVDTVETNNDLEILKEKIKSMNPHLSPESNDNLQKNLYLATQINLIYYAMDKFEHSIRNVHPITNGGKQAIEKIEEKVFSSVLKMLDNI